MRNKKNYHQHRWGRYGIAMDPHTVLARASNRRIADKAARVEYDRQSAKAKNLEIVYCNEGLEPDRARRVARAQFGCLAEEDAVKAGRPSHP